MYRVATVLELNTTKIRRVLDVLGRRPSLVRRRFRKNLQARLANAPVGSAALDKLITALFKHLSGSHTREVAATLNKIEKKRHELLNISSTTEEVDFGTGYADARYAQYHQRSGIVTNTPISDIAAYSKDRNWCQVLFDITTGLRPERVLEMGTCVGISGSYIASALALNGEGKIWTIEGSPNTAILARETFTSLGLSEIVTCIVGPFHEVLEPCLSKNGPFDLVFVDGHHDGTATVGYYERIKANLRPGAVVIFDDIAWSVDMADAWKVISHDPAVSGHLDLRDMGLVVL
jgi:predicted O-methyltransferase YrrM